VRRLAALLVLVALAGCGEKRPRLQGPDASVWRAAASRIAGTSCARGRTYAGELRVSAIQAINDRQVPPELQEPLLSKVNAVASWSSCREARHHARDLERWLEENSG
jgi:hypothetical protein